MLGSAVLFVAMGLMTACADEEAEQPVAGPGEPCFDNADCINDACIVRGDGTRACAGGEDDGGGW